LSVLDRVRDQTRVGFALHRHLRRRLDPLHDLSVLRSAVEDRVLRVDRLLVKEDELPERADGLLAIPEHVAVLVGPHAVHEVAGLQGHIGAAQRGAAHEQGV